MFDEEIKNPVTPLVDGINANSGPKPVFKKTAPPVNLPTTDQGEVKPRAGRTVPGTEDIFADVDEAPSQPAAAAVKEPFPRPGVMPAIGRPSPQTPSGPPEPLSELPDDLEEEAGGSKKFFWLGLGVLVIILGVGGYWAYSNFFAPSGLNIPKFNLNTPPANLNKQFQEEVVNLNLNRNLNKEEEEEAELGVTCPQLTPPAPDFCLDGEIVSGEVDESGCPLPPSCTKPIPIDSDKDGLTDLEEEELGTDVFEPDSDGDGLYDREEVKVYETNPLNPDTDGDGYLDGEEVEAGYNPKGTGKLLELNFEE